ncbi:MAG TPA: sigma-54 dependent transcriptional regulator [Polyangiaceae bacterium]|nr:sigma-54 dependent transcriptional regulator [Polyangiaceae bacterium]
MEEAGTVLIVDDDATVGQHISSELSGNGWQVELTHDPDAALKLCEQRTFDALILDLLRPASDGASMIERLRAVTPRECRPVTILMSEQLDVRSTVRAVQAGAFDVLQKPVSTADLDERLRAGLRTREREVPAQSMRNPLGDAAERILGETALVASVREQIRSVARFPDLSVVIIGETGTGKELVAEAIHTLSQTGDPFVTVNCAAIPEPLFESELFGHDAGAFTGARGAHAGLLEVAGRGTVFFDELGEMPPTLQPKLLRALETRSFRRVGGSKDLPFRARVVSATNRRLNGREGVVRSDLYFRLAGFTIVTPALRERTTDIDVLARHFLSEFSERYPEAPAALTEAALDALHAYDWPGNVRELKAVVQQSAVLSRSGSVGAEEVTTVLRERRNEGDPSLAPPASSQSRMLAAPAAGEPLRAFERRMIESAWETSGRNLSAAARTLGLPRTTLRDRLRKYGLI